ncbi:MAG: cysteine synthase family protein, partial [Candidatus Eremiobacteraeota bacterium]|nr:cysteine synthase family protein [Candidatus Eremiobacteraeota bacterium]
MTPTILGAIGNTPFVELRAVVPPGCARIAVKLESQNPTGSMKDRMAVAAIGAAERDGRLPRGGTVVEYTGGSTGTSLALVCAAKGYPIHVVTSTAFSQEKIDSMKAYGAHVTLVTYDGNGITKQLFLSMIAKAKEIASAPNTFWTDQLHNPDMAGGYEPIGDEAWRQTGGRIDAFVQIVGTSHSLRGTATALKRYNPRCTIVGVEPAESPVLSGGMPGAHDVEGVGIGYVPPLWDAGLVDRIVAVATRDAKAMARRLAREEG